MLRWRFDLPVYILTRTCYFVLAFSFYRCVVCRLEYEDGDKMLKLPCNHHYHFECIRRWLERNKVHWFYVTLIIANIEGEFSVREGNWWGWSLLYRKYRGWVFACFGSQSHVLCNDMYSFRNEFPFYHQKTVVAIGLDYQVCWESISYCSECISCSYSPCLFS